MKNPLALLFILISVSVLSAQNLNFKDTNALTKILSSRTWMCYKLNPDTTFSDKIIDSIRFYSNKTWSEREKPMDDTAVQDSWPYKAEGKWFFGTTGKASRSDSATDYIFVRVEVIIKGMPCFLWYSLVDGHRIKGTTRGKICGNLDEPFILPHPSVVLWERRFVFQPQRQHQQPKKHK